MHIHYCHAKYMGSLTAVADDALVKMLVRLSNAS